MPRTGGSAKVGSTSEPSRHQLREREKRELRHERDRLLVELAQSLGSDGIARAFGTNAATADTLVQRARGRLVAPNNEISRPARAQRPRALERGRPALRGARSQRPPADRPRAAPDRPSAITAAWLRSARRSTTSPSGHATSSAAARSTSGARSARARQRGASTRCPRRSSSATATNGSSRSRPPTAGAPCTSPSVPSPSSRWPSTPRAGRRRVERGARPRRYSERYCERSCSTRRPQHRGHHRLRLFGGASTSRSPRRSTRIQDEPFASPRSRAGLADDRARAGTRPVELAEAVDELRPSRSPGPSAQRG